MNEVLPDLLDNGLILVFCGTAASAVSARAGAYYANSTNAFWRTLYATSLTTRLFRPCEFRALLGQKIGLTDLAKFASGSDRSLRPGDFDRGRLRDNICRFRPQVMAFTSKAAWRGWTGASASRAVAYGWQDEVMMATRFYVLPSPSGAARGYWDISLWQMLADDYHRRFRAA